MSGPSMPGWLAGSFAALAETLDGSALQEGALWSLRTIPNFPPVIQTVHILGIAAVMGTLMLLNLRTLGLAGRSQQLSELTQRVLPWFWTAMAVNVIAGAFFVFARPMRYFANPVFGWKMAFLIPALVLALAIHLMSRRNPGYWQATSARLWLSRLMALASIALLIMVCVGGRWIAYLEYLQYPLWTMEPYFDGSEYPFWIAMENWGLSQVIAATNWFPTLETIHIIFATLLLSSLLWVDLRLLGVGATAYPISALHRDMLWWAWGAFAVASVTGLGMFITRASSHIENPAFIAKGILLALAGLNMAWFQWRLTPRYLITGHADIATRPPAALKLAGASSLLLWCGVMLAGRWIGHIV